MIRRTLRALPTLLRVGLAEMVAYRSELFIWILSATGPIIMLLVWDRAAAGGPIGGFDQAAFARYFTAGLVVRQLTSAWIVWEINESIRTGSLSPSLLKPVHPLVFRACENLVALPFRVAVLLPLVFAMWLWRPEVGLALGLRELPVWLLSMALAWAINFLVQVAFGSLAFFLDQSLGIFNVWFALWALLSGYMFPLELFPEAVRNVVWLLPFRGMLAVPTEIAAGQLTGIAALEAVGLQAAWVIAFAFLAHFSWRAGVRRYGAFGA